MGAASGDKYHEPFVRCSVCGTSRPMEFLKYLGESKYRCIEPTFCGKAKLELEKRNEAVK